MCALFVCKSSPRNRRQDCDHVTRFDLDWGVQISYKIAIHEHVYVLAGLAALEPVLVELGHKVAPGAGVNAARAVLEKRAPVEVNR